MAATSEIQWTDATVNFWWGCTKVGPGCDHCYAESFDKRVGGSHWGLHAPRRKIEGASALIRKLNANKPGAAVFIQSMSDIFDLEVDTAWFAEAWQHIEACDRIRPQILTKRISAVEKRLREIGRFSWPRHAGLMITVVNQAEADRDIPRLIELKKRLGIPWIGLSIEPMLSPIDLTPWLDFIDWVICGGESGARARPMHPAWARSLRDQCASAGVPFFFKQWGEFVPIITDHDGERLVCYEDGCGDLPQFSSERRFPVQTIDRQEMWRLGKKAAGRTLDGRTHDAMPHAFARREAA